MWVLLFLIYISGGCISALAFLKIMGDNKIEDYFFAGIFFVLSWIGFVIIKYVEHIINNHKKHIKNE